MKNLIYIVVIVAALAVAFNDGGRIFVAKSTLRNDTSSLAAWASNNVGGLPRDQAAAILAERAKAYGAELYQYGQDKQGVQVWTRKTVDGLWVVGTYRAVLRGVPVRQAWGSTTVVEDYVTSDFR